MMDTFSLKWPVFMTFTTSHTIILNVFLRWPCGTYHSGLSVGTHAASCWTSALHPSTTFSLIDVGRIRPHLTSILSDVCSDVQMLKVHFFLPFSLRFYSYSDISQVDPSFFSHLNSKSASFRVKENWNWRNVNVKAVVTGFGTCYRIVFFLQQSKNKKQQSESRSFECSQEKPECKGKCSNWRAEHLYKQNLSAETQF